MMRHYRRFRFDDISPRYYADITSPRWRHITYARRLLRYYDDVDTRRCYLLRDKYFRFCFVYRYYRLCCRHFFSLRYGFAIDAPITPLRPP